MINNLNVQDLTKVSIITVCFNSAKTLEQTIQSVIKQSYNNLEYIIIDAGSTDGTLDIIKKYNKHIASWISEPDKGISDAFNKGIDKATGDIVGIINSDDWYEAGAVEKIVTEFKKHSEIGFVFGDQNYVDLAGNLLFTQKGDSNYEKMIRFEMPSIPHPTVFLRRQVYQRFGGFNLEYKTAMDYELLLRFFVNGVKGLYIPHILANMRAGGESHFNYLGAFQEVMKAAAFYGYPKVLLLLHFGYKYVKTKIRRILQKSGLNFVVNIVRNYILKDQQIIYTNKK